MSASFLARDQIDAMTRETNRRTNSVHYLSAEASGYIAIIHRRECTFDSAFQL